jgi:hypothetical protein
VTEPRFFSSLQLWLPPGLPSTQAFFPLGVKGPRRDADHSPTSNAEVKKSGATPPLLNSLN